MNEKIIKELKEQLEEAQKEQVYLLGKIDAIKSFINKIEKLL